jgi:hypothetical protein
MRCIFYPRILGDVISYGYGGFKFGILDGGFGIFLE